MTWQFDNKTILWNDKLMKWEDGDITIWWNDKLMKWEVGDMTIWWNENLMKWQFDEMTIWWNDNLMKWQFDEMTIWWNDNLMKWQFDEMTIWWNDNLMKWQFDEMTIWWNDYATNCQFNKIQSDEMTCWQDDVVPHLRHIFYEANWLFKDFVNVDKQKVKSVNTLCWFYTIKTNLQVFIALCSNLRIYWRRAFCYLNEWCKKSFKFESNCRCHENYNLCHNNFWKITQRKGYIKVLSTAKTTVFSKRLNSGH
jgi:hypothetical protein